ncbi:hypothetical protein [Dehalobacterium formicoaceticum]|uniref:hypothetical protein n=1 Tax=Dehalobacterium formicoaceticum TaxID=51515 RepID=UPI000B7D7105|nr:hypothetical protein [Dehalobacterium formicoaceticum]
MRRKVCTYIIIFILVILVFVIAACNIVNDKINSEGNRDIEGNTITEITITPELREKYFDLAWNNRFDFIPDFPLNAPPSVAQTYLEYAWLLCRMDDALIGGENGGFTTYYLDQFVFNHFKGKRQILPTYSFESSYEIMSP